MLNISRSVLCIIVILLFSASVLQAEFRVATIDVNKILNASKLSEGKKERLDKLSSAAKKKVEARKKELKELEAKLADNKNPQEAENFRTKARDFTRFVKDTEEDLKREFLKVNRELTEKVLKTVRAHAKAQNLDLVLQKDEQGRGAVLFGITTADITDDIIKQMNG